MEGLSIESTALPLLLPALPEIVPIDRVVRVGGGLYLDVPTDGQLAGFEDIQFAGVGTEAPSAAPVFPITMESPAGGLLRVALLRPIDEETVDGLVEAVEGLLGDDMAAVMRKAFELAIEAANEVGHG